MLRHLCQTLSSIHLMIRKIGIVIFNIYKPHSGISLETQFLPNDINLYGNKVNSILKANEHFYSKTTYHISEK